MEYLNRFGPLVGRILLANTFNTGTQSSDAVLELLGLMGGAFLFSAYN